MLHTTPTAAELLAAVREFLQHDLLPNLTDDLSFYVRVAANVLGQVEREMTIGPASEFQFREVLTELGVSDEAELSCLIRTKRVVADATVVEALSRITRDRLRVSNPAYLEAVVDDDPRAEFPV